MTHEEVWNAIEKFAVEHGMSCSGLARSSGLDATTFNKSKRESKYGQPRWPSMETVAKVLDATKNKVLEMESPLPYSFAEAFDALIKKRGTTNEKLAELSGFSSKTISRLRNKDTKPEPSSVVAVCICELPA